MTMAEQQATPANHPKVPRDDGGPVFNAPWEARIFATVTALAEAGCFSWSDFQAALIAEIAAAGEDPAAPYQSETYYRHWLAAAETLLTARGLLPAGALQQGIEAALADV